jgi:hypothetical protein
VGISTTLIAAEAAICNEFPIGISLWWGSKDYHTKGKFKANNGVTYLFTVDRAI